MPSGYPLCLPAIRFAFRSSDSPSGHPIKSAGSSFRGRCKNTIFLFKRKATPITEPRGSDLRSILPETAPFSPTSAPHFSTFAFLALTSAPSSPKPLHSPRHPLHTPRHPLHSPRNRSCRPCNRDVASEIAQNCSCRPFNQDAASKIARKRSCRPCNRDAASSLEGWQLRLEGW